MPGGALRCRAALGHVQGVDAVVLTGAGRVHGHPSHVVECRIERQTRTHPQIHIGT